MRALLLFLLLFGSSAGAQAEPAIVLHAGRLLSVPGAAPLERQTLVVRGKEIAEIRAGFVPASEFGPDAVLIDLSSRFVLPGLMDVHMHVASSIQTDKIRSAMRSPAELALRGARHGREMLDAGITTIRDVGDRSGAVFQLRDAIARGDVPGPRIYAAGPIVSRTGGHGAEDTIASGVPNPRPSATCDGTESCRRVIRAVIGQGADLIKISVSGSASEPTGERGAVPNVFEDEVQAIVAAAAQLGRPVAAHAHSAASINMALRAGVRTIEHGTYFDDESVKLFKQTGAYLVSTSFVGELMLTEDAIRKRNTPEDWERIKKAAIDQRKTGARGFRAGIKIGIGTDTMADSKPTDTIRELAIFVEEGVPAAEAIKAATVNNADIVGRAASLGQLRPGYVADIVALPGDPLANIGALYKIDFVMKDGAVYRQPAVVK